MSQAAIPISRTKIIVPAQRPEILRRQRLLALLDELLEKKLVLVSAPAGYGKTSLLVDMAHSSPMPVCWFSVDALDQDPQRFLQYLIASISQRYPRFGSRSRSALNSLTTLEHGLENLMVTLVNEIYERINEHFALVIDDYQFVDSVAEVRNFLSRFVRLLSENCHVVLASRRLPALPDMALLVAGDQVGGFSLEELAFNPEEIRLLYHRNFKIELRDEEIEEIYRQTEGWITGLQLTRLTALNLLPDLTRSARTTGVDLAIYFDEQVLSHQVPEVRQFLLESSLLEEFDSAMCQEVLGSLHPAAQPDWKNLVETVRRGNLFSLSVGPRGRWLRYHHLFQEFLKARLQEEQPEQAGWIIRRLAGYHNTHLNWEAAYRIYKQLGDQGEILALIERSGSAMIASDRIITLGGWLQDLPEGSLGQHPILASLAGTVKLIQGELQPAVSLLDQAVGALSLDSDPLQLALALARRANVQRLLGRYAESLEDAESAMQILRPDGGHPEIFAVALRMKGLCQFRLGQTRQAVESLEQALQLLVRNQDEKGIPPAQIDLGMAYRALGDHDQARSLYMQALEALRRQGNLTWQSNLLNSLGVLLGLDGDYEQAVRRLEEAMDLSRRSGDAHTQALAYASLGDIYEEIEDLELADQAHSNTESYARQTNSRFLLHYSLLAKARIARRMAHFPRATSLLEELRLPIGQSNSNFEQGLYELEWGRLYLCSGDPRSALPPLERAVQAFERGELTLERGISLLWLTAARLQGSEPASAAQAFELLLPVLGQKQYQHVLGMTAFQVHGWLDRLESSTQIRRQIEPFFQHAKLVRAGFPTLRKRIRRMSGSIPVLPARMRINTLGKAQVYINGRLVTNSQWKTRAVRELFFFMLSASRPMKKEEIGAVLWPEVTDEVLRLRFKNNMYRLRNATSQNVILYGNELYAFNHELNPSYDLEAFRSTLERARRESDIAEQIRHYRTAVDLVRGRYLEDFDSTWVLSERERLEQEYLDALISLARLQFKVGNLSQALTTCRKALAWDDCFEEAHRLMMEIHAASGDRTALARQYQGLAEVLMRELGVSPSEETENLYRTLAT